MADSPYNPPSHPAQTAAASMRNLSTTIAISAESDPFVVPAAEFLAVHGIPFIRVTNNAGGATIVSSTTGVVTTPMTEEDGTAISIADATCRLVDVRGVSVVSFPSEDVTVVLVN